MLFLDTGISLCLNAESYYILLHPYHDLLIEYMFPFCFINTQQYFNKNIYHGWACWLTMGLGMFLTSGEKVTDRSL